MSEKELPKFVVLSKKQQAERIKSLGKSAKRLQEIDKDFKIKETVKKIFNEHGIDILMLSMELDKETSDAVLKVLDYYKSSLKKKIEGLRLKETPNDHIAGEWHTKGYNEAVGDFLGLMDEE